MTTPAPIFLYGPLLAPAVQHLIWGRVLTLQAACYPNARMVAPPPQALADAPPLLVAGDPEAVVMGAILPGHDPALRAEFERYARRHALLPERVWLLNAEGTGLWAELYRARGRGQSAGQGEWAQEACLHPDWQGVQALTQAWNGAPRTAPRTGLRAGPIAVRAASRARAQGLDPAPHVIRRDAQAEDVSVAQWHQPYAHFFSVEEYELSWRRFEGSMSAEVNRAVFISGDAVTVLPYDPLRDRVLLVEQFRAGPFARGDRQPWQLEAIAGRIDAGESPEAAARREAVEEAGLSLGALLPVANYYPSPAAKSEFIYSYVALCDLPDGAGIISGVESEQEDIRGHVLDFEVMMALIASGEIANAPLILTAFWLQRERGELRSQLSAVCREGVPRA